MSESVVSPTPVFMAEVNAGRGIAGPAVIGGTSAVSLHTDVPSLVFAGLAELRAHANTNAASVAALRTEIADRFAQQNTAALQARIDQMTAAAQDGLLKAIANKVGAGA